MSISKKKAISVLKEIYRIANHASLTGALGCGGKALASMYNKIREISMQNKWVDEELIEGLIIGEKGKEDEMESIGIAAKLFAAMLEVEEDFKYAEAKEYDENGYEIKDESEE